jgi:hypothetical protein
VIRRGTAAALGGTIACAALVACVLGATGVADRRHDGARLYLAERDALDAAAARAALGHPDAPETRTIRLCPHGADTLAAAVVARLALGVVGADGLVDLGQLARISSLALIAERRAEKAAAGGALPQRMGREKTGADRWQAVAPAAVPCRGGTAYASVPVDLP